MGTDASHTYVAQSGLIGGPFPNHKTLFSARPGARSLDGGNTVQLVLDAEQDGVKLTKTFTFTRGDYAIDVKHTVSNVGAAPVTPSVYLQLVRDDGKLEGDSKFYSTFNGPALYTETEKFRKVTFDDIAKGKNPPPAQADNGWIAMVQHYFASAWIPGDKFARDIYAGRIDNGLYRIGMQTPLGVVAQGSTIIEKSRLFVGPQEESVLETIAPGFELLKDYGYLTILAKPIFWLLEKIHGYVGNWGWSIVLLTVLIKLAFFPLSAASYKSMARMKEVQPRLMAMREQYKGEPQKLNQAMMEMYRKEKINPLGGCLPVVIQIPVFIALYWVLLSSVELRGAPWILWVHDLSLPDTSISDVLGMTQLFPIGILPIIMAVSMFVQTKLNPTPPDPIQAKVMLYMPIVFSVMFFFFPSGLVLYWVVNNLLSIAQQWQINQMFAKKEAK